MTRKESVHIFLEKVKAAYINDQSTKKIRASGKSAEDFKSAPESTGGKLYGSDYLKYQFTGRRPGGFPPIDAIINWIKVKGIAKDESEKGLKSFAFAIARKIAKKGTDIFQGKRSGLNIDDKILEYRKELVRNIIDSVKKEFKESTNKLKV
jgi:hypothetical protein